MGLTYQDMPTASREELLAELDPTATLSKSDVLSQLWRLEGDARERRLLNLTERMARLTWIAALLSFGALIVAVLSLARP